MITPDKYLDLKHSLINVSACVIKDLQRIKVLSYSELENEICKLLGEDTKYIFPYALNFLFLLDKIEYNKNIDSLSIKK
ncbi:MAG: hypothetical protein Q8M71_05060 [Thermodesulfovibrionales bacterium]|nr:hypothetical protein [Thermodesulfovibrionales bacterium]